MLKNRLRNLSFLGLASVAAMATLTAGANPPPTAGWKVWKGSGATYGCLSAAKAKAKDLKARGYTVGSVFCDVTGFSKDYPTVLYK